MQNTKLVKPCAGIKIQSEEIKTIYSLNCPDFFCLAFDTDIL